MSRLRYCIPAVTAAALAAGLLPQGAMGQQIEEIVVTARKVEEKLLDAPVAVSAFTAKAIEDQGIANLDALSRYTPGLSFSQTFGRTTDRPVIRGQSNVLAGVQFGVESGVGYFIDGVYFPGFIQNLDFNSLERVEIIRGPQSALYGRNTYSGAINFVTKRPGANPGVHAKGVVARYGERDLSLSAEQGFLDGRLGARAFARVYDYDGEYVNTLTGKKVNEESTKTLGFSLDWEATDDLGIRFFGFATRDNDGPMPLFLQPASMNNCMPGYRSAAYRSANPGSNPNQYYCGEIKPGKVALNTDPIPQTGGRDGTAFDGYETREYFSSLKIDWDINGSGWGLTSLTGYRNYKNKWGTDSDHSAAFVLIPRYNPVAGFPQIPPVGSFQEIEPLFANTKGNDIRSISTELRLSSPQSERLRGATGVYYYDYKDNGIDLSFARPATGKQDYAETIKDSAIYGLLSYDITESVTLTAELRYQQEKKKREEYCSTASSANDYNPWTDSCTNWSATRGPGDPGYYERQLGVPHYQGDKTFYSTTPRVTLDWKVNPDVMLYGVYARGAKPGGLNGAIGNTLGRPSYNEEESDNFELGSKLSLFDQRVRLSAAGYFIRARDVQFTQAALTAAGQGAVTSIATNQGRGEIKGLEMDVQTALTDAISLSAAYSYTDTEITRGCDDFQYVLNTGGLVYDPQLGTVSACDLSGKSYPLVPKTTASLSLTYDNPLPFGHGLSLIGNVGASYESSKYIQIHNLAETGSSTLVDMRLGVRSEDGWSVVLFGRNLTDEDTIIMATRWLDLTVGTPVICGGGATPCIPATPTPGTAGGGDTASPRAFFGTLRKGRSFGIEFTYDFKL
ncbi:MAG: TonB-dependent receptor [Gammaproteobacteria bacterium]|nr:TonB-dependent receptor [Gammaproteobacteria bacterium]